jgi:hypothetical protein
MKKKPAPKRVTGDKTGRDAFEPLLAEVRQLIHSARRGEAAVVDTLQVLTNFEIGRRIVEHEQKGEKRAAYGAELLKGLSVALTQEFGPGYSLTNLKLMRRFFFEYRSRIGQTPSDQSSQRLTNGQTASDQIPTSRRKTKPSGELIAVRISETLTRKSPFNLNWSHYVELTTLQTI